MVSITLRFKWGTGGWGYNRGGRRWRVAGPLGAGCESGRAKWGTGLNNRGKKKFKKKYPGL